MKKKLEKHAIDIATSPSKNPLQGVYQYTMDGDFYVTDTARVLQTETDIKELELNAHAIKFTTMIKDAMEQANKASLNYTLYGLPTVQELKDGIKELAGRKQSRVVWSDGKITMNARFLVKAMEALNATKCYVAKGKEHRMPILLVEDDDPQSLNRELIFGVVNKDERKGFWIA